MDQPWYTFIVPKDQFVYYSVTKWKYDPILGKKNDWLLMYLSTKVQMARNMNHEKNYTTWLGK